MSTGRIYAMRTWKVFASSLDSESLSSVHWPTAMFPFLLKANKVFLLLLTCVHSPPPTVGQQSPPPTVGSCPKSWSFQPAPPADGAGRAELSAGHTLIQINYLWMDVAPWRYKWDGWDWITVASNQPFEKGHLIRSI